MIVLWFPCVTSVPIICSLYRICALCHVIWDLNTQFSLLQQSFFSSCNISCNGCLLVQTRREKTSHGFLDHLSHLQLFPGNFHHPAQPALTVLSLFFFFLLLLRHNSPPGAQREVGENVSIFPVTSTVRFHYHSTKHTRMVNVQWFTDNLPLSLLCCLHS